MVGLSAKHIAELSFSPTAIGNLANYAHRVQKRQRLYGLALIPLSLLVIIASLMSVFLGPTETQSSVKSSLAADQPLSEAAFKTTLRSNKHTAAPGETITWTLSVVNQTENTLTEDVQFVTADIDEYAHVLGASAGGVIADKDHYVLWPNVTLDPADRQTFSVSTRVDQPISHQALSATNSASHDCRMSAIFGDRVNVDVNCPVTKRLEFALSQLPPQPLSLAAYIGAGLLLVDLVAYLALRLHSNELRIIRKQINTGGL